MDPSVTTYSSPELGAVFAQFVIVLFIVRRSYAMSQGVPFSVRRLAVAPGLILILWTLSELESILLTPWAVPYLVTVDVTIVIVATLAFSRITEGMTEVKQGASGEWSFRIGISIAMLYLGVFLVRLTLTVILFPSSLEFGSTPGGFPPLPQQIALGVIDAIYSVSTGLLLGRSMGIARKVRTVRDRLSLPLGA